MESRLESDVLTLTKEAILLICDSMSRSENFGINFTHCSNNGKIAVLSTIREIYPQISLLPVLLHIQVE